MNNIRPIWTPQDSIDTAHQFHMELHNAERGHRHCLRCDKSQLVVRIDATRRATGPGLHAVGVLGRHRVVPSRCGA